MTRPPEFDALVAGVDSPEEEDRLRRVHELLVASGPPPELSPALVAAPEAPAAEEEEPEAEWLPRRRLWAGLLVGAGALVAAFGIGYYTGNDSTETPVAEPATPARVISLQPTDESKTAGAVIRLGRKRADGNWPMTLTVRGLDHLSTKGDYYALALLKKGKAVVTCGTFNVASSGATSIPMIAAYDLENFDGWAVTQYHHQSQRETVVMRET